MLFVPGDAPLLPDDLAIRLEDARRRSGAGIAHVDDGHGPQPLCCLLPRALRLPAEVLADEAGWLRLRFLDVDEACRELLVRHVFQQHRRRLAGARRAQKSA